MDSNLRALADYFLSRSDAASVVPAEIHAKLLPHVFVLDVEAGNRLRVRLAGSVLDRTFGRPLMGHFLEDFAHGPRGSDVLREFHACAKNHAPFWMREIVRITGRAPRYVEGVGVFLAPDRIYGGLVAGELAGEIAGTTFESAPL